jgi:hypothetical protein
MRFRAMNLPPRARDADGVLYLVERSWSSVRSSRALAQVTLGALADTSKIIDTTHDLIRQSDELLKHMETLGSKWRLSRQYQDPG